MLSREGRSRARSWLRSRSPRAPRRSLRDVGQEAPQARRLSGIRETRIGVHAPLPWGERVPDLVFEIGNGLFAYNPSVLARAGAWLDRAAFKPASLPDDLVTGIALLPPVVAGLIIFKLPAAEMLGIAAGTGAIGLLIARWLWRHGLSHSGSSPLIAAIFGVALIGAGASL